MSIDDWDNFKNGSGTKEYNSRSEFAFNRAVDIDLEVSDEFFRLGSASAIDVKMISLFRRCGIAWEGACAKCNINAHTSDNNFFYRKYVIAVRNAIQSINPEVELMSIR